MQVQPYPFDTRRSIPSKPMIDRRHSQGIKVFSDAPDLLETLDSSQRAIRDGIDL